MKEKINSIDFLKDNLKMTCGKLPIEVNMAFYNGAKWVEPGESYDIITSSLNNGITWRVLINTVEVANTFSEYESEAIREKWKALSEKYPHELLVRECSIPLFHIYHSIKLFDEETKKYSGSSHVKFFAYDKKGILVLSGDEAYESGSEEYVIYDDEFEYLWENSKPL